mmetsp:Transcript_58554/g.181852  ORF Transcript_58554/g.181852 Transcript_58554/m.181852 type:complete len:283 (-) Transcript_58554:335-1183(-)
MVAARAAAMLGLSSQGESSWSRRVPSVPWAPVSPPPASAPSAPRAQGSKLAAAPPAAQALNHEGKKPSELAGAAASGGAPLRSPDGPPSAGGASARSSAASSCGGSSAAGAKVPRARRRDFAPCPGNGSVRAGCEGPGDSSDILLLRLCTRTVLLRTVLRVRVFRCHTSTKEACRLSPRVPSSATSESTGTLIVDGASNISKWRFISACMRRPSMSFWSFPNGFSISTAMKLSDHRMNTWMSTNKNAHTGCVTHCVSTNGAMSQCIHKMRSQFCAYGNGKGM